MISISWCFLFSLLYIVNDTIAVSFFGHQFNDHLWSDINANIRCQSSQGLWTNKTTATTNTYPRTPAAQSPCDREEKLNGHSYLGKCLEMLTNPSMGYSWEVSDICKYPLKIFNSSHLCKMMREKVKGNIIFVGDSIQHEFAAEFTTAMHIELGNRDPAFTCNMCYAMCVAKVMYPQYCINDDGATYENYFNVSVARSDHLQAHEEEGEEENHDEAHNVHHIPWLRTLRPNNIKIVILNRGAHFSPTDEVIAGLNETLKSVFRIDPSISVIWRNTAPGHDFAFEKFFNPPLTVRPKEYGPYHWNEFEDQNNAVEFFLAQNFPQVLYLDVFSATALREDSHMDGLHYCIPGPIGLWPILLYNAMDIIFRGAHNHTYYPHPGYYHRARRLT